tara:strand:+ start:271 stop:708 length:438 start_codon:yes stop_codon:yes gene_type:complete
MKQSATKEFQEIKDVLSRWIDAASNRDIDAIMELYHDDICSYDAVGPLQFNGRVEYHAHWKCCMPDHGEMIFQSREPVIRASGQLAVAHFLIRCGIRNEDGSEQASWMRASKHLEKQDGQWRIVHEHFSVPFDIESGEAQFGLAP